MNSILLGIKDYCKDCWHDFIRKEAVRYGWSIHEAVGYYKNGRVKVLGVPVWKEGNLWHYIQQRKLTQKRKKLTYR